MSDLKDLADSRAPCSQVVGIIRRFNDLSDAIEYFRKCREIHIDFGKSIGKSDGRVEGFMAGILVSLAIVGFFAAVS